MNGAVVRIWASAARRPLLAAYCACAVVCSAQAAELPTPCAAGACGAVTTWVTSGNATATLTSNSLSINQTSANAVLNWSSFNISSDGAVTFTQPDSSSVALNRIYQADPSRIFGALNANGRIYLLNQNGILFGEGARVNVGGLVASSLNISKEALEDGLARAVDSGRAAFERFVDETGVVLPSGVVEVQRGADIRTSEGGQVFMFAPNRVTNAGTIATPDGQTILAAGSSVYLATSSDPNLRGLLVEVDAGGIVTNGVESNAAVTDPSQLVGRIVAERGNVTLAGLAVNQLGRVSATTSIRSAGSVRLQAREGAVITGSGATLTLEAERGGALTLGQRSVTEVGLDATDDSTQVDVNRQPRSQVDLSAARVNLLEHSRVAATSGRIAVTAAQDLRVPIDGISQTPDASRIYMAPSAHIDVSGAAIELPMEHNVVRVELRGSQLADSPLQRDGVLRGETVYVDARVSGVRADGSVWRGTPLADVSGDLAAVQRGLGERNLTGGEVTLVAHGDVILSAGSLIDVSGGSIAFREGYIATTQLVSNGRVVDIGAADPNRIYSGVADGYVLQHSRWGVTETFAGFTGAAPGRFERGYVQGHDAGALSVIAPRAILDGDLQAGVTIGPRQRTPSGIVAANSLYRPSDELPLAGRLQIGHDSRTELANFVATNVDIREDAVLPTLSDPGGASFDPRNDALSEDFMSTRVRPSMLHNAGAGRLAVFANEEVRLAEGVSLTTAPGGEVSLTGNTVLINGSIDAPAGQITIASQTTLADPFDSGGVRVGEGARLRARGEWVNDGAAANAPGAQLAPRLINGGAVRLNARQGGLELEQGSSIDVSAGAWLRPNGSIVGGRGGAISLSASESPTREATPFVLGAQLAAYALAEGGSLSVAANEVCISALDCSGGRVGSLWLSPEFFAQGGFGSYEIASNRGGLHVLREADIRPQQTNWRINADVSRVGSGADLRTFTEEATLGEFDRRPTHLALGARISAGDEPFTAARFAAAPGLTVEAGAFITADPQSRISFRSNSWMSIDGEIRAPSGQVQLTLSGELSASEFLPQQGVWLGAQSLLDASGAARVRADDLGRRSGVVLDGGVVSLTAQRGYVVVQSGATIDVSGAEAQIDIPDSSQSASYTRRVVASDAGHIAITAAEGVVLSGELRAFGGAGEGAQGGRLSVALDTYNRGALTIPNNRFPDAARTIRVQAEASASAVAPHSAPPDFLNGLAVIDAQTLQRSGVSALHLSAGNVRPSRGSLDLLSAGVIELHGDLNIALADRVVLDAATVHSTGGEARIAAPYVRFGQAARDEQDGVLSAAAGDGSLRVEAGLLDFVGRSALSGFANVALHSDGDIRLRGVQPSAERIVSGELLTAANVTLSADQIYPSTLTSFDIKVAGADDAFIRVLPNGEGQDVLSAGGRLTLSAPIIEQHGVLRAPFGEVTLQAERVVLGAGAVTSTSAEGLVIPFGETQGGFDWVYALEDDQTLVFGGADDLPRQRVAIDADDIDIQPDSVIDVSGGGDLLAYEWVRGVGGTRDVLASDRPGQFAILPARNLRYAPDDPLAARSSALTPGESVYLYGGNGLREGEYALLPARYALLPGAYLVTAVNGYTDIAPGQQFNQPDGSIVVAGYRTLAGTAFRDARTSGFAVRSGASVQTQARYDLTRANEFFADRAVQLDLAAPRLPRDAGVLSLVAGERLSLAGRLIATPAEAGRGAALDISADRLRIIGAEGAAREGEIAITAAAINGLGAESVLIGGARRQTDAGLELAIAAQTVIVDGGAQLRAPELLIAAQDRVAIESGAIVSANGAETSAAEALLIEGDGALLRAATGPQSRIRRSGGNGLTGALDIAAGAAIEANAGAVMLESTLDTTSAGDLRVVGGSLNLAASTISIGDAAPAGAGLALTNTQLDALELRELVLTSQSSIDVYGAAQFGVERLQLEASGVRSMLAGDSLLTASDSIALSNANDRTVASAPAAGGTLGLRAEEIELGRGAFSFTGFEHVDVQAAQLVRAGANGSLLSEGRVTLTTPVVTSGSGVAYSISTSGVLQIQGSSAANPAPVAVDALGGALSVLGERVEVSGVIALAGGRFVAEASGGEDGDVVIREGALIDVSGRTTLFDGVPVHADAGGVRLTAARGDVIVEAGARIDVSGADAGGNAGSIAFAAAQGDVQVRGELDGAAASGFRGGAVEVDAGSFGDFAAVNRQLNAGGFDQARRFRLRGPGDINIVAGAENVVRAHEVSLAADQGRIAVLGAIDASGARGGRVLLSASDGVDVAGAIDASASAENAAGGRIELHANGGSLTVRSSARLDVSGGVVTAAHGGRGGQVLYRAERGAINTLLTPDSADDRLSLSGTVLGARTVTLEGFERFERSSLGAMDFIADASNPIFASAESFMSNASALRAALGVAADEAFVIAPGVEIYSTGDLVIADDWNLATWRFADGASGVLTLRSAGTLRVLGSLSDGFASPTGFLLPGAPTQSWSYRLAAGADLGAANVFALLDRGMLAAGAGDLIVGEAQQVAPRMIRSGTGNIDIAAARDVQLADRTSVIYTAGASGPGVPLVMTGRLLRDGARAYPVDGGDISIVANGDIKGAASNQLVTDWLWRVGRPNTASSPSPTAWTVNFQSFRQNVGALAGGDIVIRAGGDIEHLSANIASIGRQVGGASAASNAVEIVGGGFLDVEASGSIRGGSYYVGLGDGRIAAGADVGATLDELAVAPILALGDARLNVTARRDLALEAILDPMLLPQGATQAVSSNGPDKTSFFSSYQPRSAVSLAANAGDVVLRNNPARLGPLLSSMTITTGNEVGLKIYPSTLRAVAHRGDLALQGSMSLFPATGGNVELFAEGDIVAQREGGAVQLLMSDADPAYLPSINAPAAGIDRFVEVLNEAITPSPNLHAATPMHLDETGYARVVARLGSIVMQPENQSDSSGFFFARPARLVAGTDIRDVTVYAQNLRDADVTSLIAGRDIVYTAQRSSFGNLTPSAREITVDGPGRLELVAGRNVDLQTSRGVTTRGNLTNRALAPQGAAIAVLAGLGNAVSRDTAAFIDNYLVLGEGYDADLIGYMEARTGEQGLTQAEAQQRFEQFAAYREALRAYVEARSGVRNMSEADALAAFRSYSPSEQQGLIEHVFFGELRASGRAAAAAGLRNEDFSRGFNAVELLTPGANPDLEAGEVNPYRGDVSLYFSRMYTLDGGDISLFAPGGEINAGLAAPPDSFGIVKAPAELGVVAQSTGSVQAFSFGDFQVNESRVFAADGGDILVWSTRGDIDAGRGAKTAISAPAPTITFDSNGNPEVTFPAALTGSGIQTLATTPERKPGNVDLFAPRGVVNAGDAGIVAGNLTIAATAVLGADNIQVSGVSVGVPVDAGGVGASLAGVSSVASSASNAAAEVVDANRGEEQPAQSLADTALSWLEVFVVGLGEDQCDPKDTECLKRQNNED